MHLPSQHLAQVDDGDLRMAALAVHELLGAVGEIQVPGKTGRSLRRPPRTPMVVVTGSCRSRCLAENLPFELTRRPADVRAHPQPAKQSLEAAGQAPLWDWLPTFDFYVLSFSCF
jgi:hypothetical protein